MTLSDLDDADNLAGALGVLLDQVDYTAGACRLNEMVGAVLSKEVIELCRQRLAAHRDKLIARAAQLRSAPDSEKSKGVP